jgi:hypothetical protein
MHDELMLEVVNKPRKLVLQKVQRYSACHKYEEVGKLGSTNEKKLLARVVVRHQWQGTYFSHRE